MNSPNLTTKPSPNTTDTLLSTRTLTHNPTTSTYDQITAGLSIRHAIPLASTAAHYYNTCHYADCAKLCDRILAAEPAEAIQARAHMYLAMEGVGSQDAARRLRHAERAVELWGLVIEWKGASRFPVEKARVEREGARGLVRVARGVVEGEGGGVLGHEEGDGVE